MILGFNGIDRFTSPTLNKKPLRAAKYSYFTSLKIVSYQCEVHSLYACTVVLHILIKQRLTGE